MKMFVFFYIKVLINAPTALRSGAALMQMRIRVDQA